MFMTAISLTEWHWPAASSLGARGLAGPQRSEGRAKSTYYPALAVTGTV